MITVTPAVTVLLVMFAVAAVAGVALLAAVAVSLVAERRSLRAVSVTAPASHDSRVLTGSR